MERKFETKGYWWLPENEDNKIAGLLYESDDGRQYLELFGRFEETSFSANVKKYNIINGFSSKGRYYTLFDTFVYNQTFNMPGFTNTTILVNIVFEDLLVNSPDEINFNSIFTTFQYLDDWILINGLKINAENVKKQNVTYFEPDALQYNINNIFTLCIRFKAFPSTNAINTREITIKQNIEIELVAKDNTLEWFLEKLQALKYLLMLLMNNPTKYLFLKGKSSKTDKIVTIYFKQNNEIQLKDSIGILDILVQFDKIKDRFSDILNTWFSLYNNYKSSFILFFESIYLLKKLNLENKFLNIIHSLESYHRKNQSYSNSYMGKEEYLSTIYKDLTKHIPTDLEEDFKEALKSKLKYGYEYSLRRRIKELFHLNNEFISGFIINSDILQKEIIETRNYLTHYDEKTNFVRDGNYLFDLCEKIKVVFIILLLFELNFSISDIKILIEEQELNRRLYNVSGKHYEFK
jgi:hypothetical protein